VLIRGEITVGSTREDNRTLWDEVSLSKCAYFGIFEDLQGLVSEVGGRFAASRLGGTAEGC
jgi:hypothetical protein